VTAKALLVDFGGVLTTSIVGALRAFEEREGLPKGLIFEVLAEAYVDHEGVHPISRLERGEITGDEFDAAIMAEMRARGHQSDITTLYRGMLSGLGSDPAMWAVVHRARAAGIRTALLSNSWGDDLAYPREQLDAAFDIIVISGEVSLRKPDRAIYLHTAVAVGVDPIDCAFVDDLQRNVDGAVATGMFGVHHRDAATTAAELEGFLAVDLTGTVTP